MADIAADAHPGRCPGSDRFLLGRRAPGRHLRPLERAPRWISHYLSRAVVRPDGYLAGDDSAMHPLCAGVALDAIANPAPALTAQSHAQSQQLLDRRADWVYALSAARWGLPFAGSCLARSALGCGSRRDLADLRLAVLVVLFVDCGLYAIKSGGRARTGPVRQIPGC